MDYSKLYNEYYGYINGMIISILIHSIVWYIIDKNLDKYKVINKYFQDKTKRSLLSANIIAGIHAVISFICSYLVVKDMKWNDLFGSNFETYFVGDRILSQDISMGITSGYMFYDAIFHVLPYDLSKNMDFLIHHIVILSAYTGSVYFRMGAHLPSLLQLAEFTTPFYHLRWYLHSIGCGEYSIVKLLEAWFLFSFLAIRGVFYFILAVFPLRYICLRVYNKGWNKIHLYEPSLLALTAAFILLNWVWVVVALQTAKKAVFGSGKKKTKKAE